MTTTQRADETAKMALVLGKPDNTHQYLNLIPGRFNPYNIRISRSESNRFMGARAAWPARAGHVGGLARLKLGFSRRQGDPS